MREGIYSWTKTICWIWNDRTPLAPPYHGLCSFTSDLWDRKEKLGGGWRQELSLSGALESEKGGVQATGLFLHQIPTISPLPPRFFLPHRYQVPSEPPQYGLQEAPRSPRSPGRGGGAIHFRSCRSSLHSRRPHPRGHTLAVTADESPTARPPLG